jgi:hypothetical protein
VADSLCFYLDDSGARDPDRAFDGHEKNQDWFALGGLIIQEGDVAKANEAIQTFRAAWPELKGAPLHSYEIRNRVNRYRWLALASAERKTQFILDLTNLISSLPIYTLACVIDRPGYNHRYREKYGPRRWMLCRTAYSIVIERAVKYAMTKGSRLRVFAERSDKLTEAQFRAYHEHLRHDGMPFDKDNSGKYKPLSADEMKKTLIEFRIKGKESDLMQIADLVLWPVAKGGYEPEHRAFKHLRDKEKLLEALCTAENGLMGTKYSCFDAVKRAPEKQKPA